MSKYATTTTVTVEKSRAEIEQILMRYGADQFMYGTDREKAIVMFRMKGRQIQFSLKYEPIEKFKYTPTRQIRTKENQQKAWEQDQRTKWRAFVLVIKAKLEAVESGIMTFEDEFLANIMLPNGKTVSDFIQPQIEEAYTSGKMPMLLPYFDE